jgi:carbonic anhydrase
LPPWKQSYKPTGAVRDIRDRKLAEQAGQEAINIIEKSPVAAFLWQNETNWSVEFVTRNVTRIFAYSDEDFFSGRVVYCNVVHPEDIERIEREVTTYSREPERTEFTHEPYRIVAKDGCEFLIADSGAPILNSQRDIIGVVLVFRDITERQRMETELLKMEKLKSLGVLAGGIAHDFNNFLTGIIGNLSCWQLGEDVKMNTALEALDRLRSGNRRFVSDDLQYCSTPTMQPRRSELVDGQAPFAIILGCSDSRVPAEIIFDQGLGDLFVIRVAGNIVGHSQIGSIEFAAEHFGTRLVVVLGHTRCGAVSATIKELRLSAECRSLGLCSIVDRIRPSVEPLLESAHRQDPETILQRAVRSNIIASANRLRQGSPILKEQIQNHQLIIVGAEYSVETGAVDFFDGLPDVS